KSYFAFEGGGKISRPVNAGLFSEQALKKWPQLMTEIDAGKRLTLKSNEITKIVYSAAIAFCCAIDLIKRGDQQRPGTFFSYLIGHMVASKFGVNPQTSLPLINPDIDTRLPTDF